MNTMTFTKGLHVLTEKKIKVALYDMSIENVDERREKRLEFESMQKAANFLGQRTSTVGLRMNNKHYVYHRETRNKYAIRQLQ